MVRELKRRRSTSWRLPVLESNRRSDPWWYEPPTAGYAAAARHLLSHGLVPAPNRDVLRALWKRGGHDRHVAALIAERWGMVA
jgi:hypothetical protein